MNNRITILGCGPSAGVPKAGYAEGPYWGQCDPCNPKNNRLRASVYVEYQGLRILVDASPDLRQQLLRHNLFAFDAVLITHLHADHIQGLDELRPLVFTRGEPLPLFANARTLAGLQEKFNYLFTQGNLSIYPQVLVPNLVDEQLSLGNVTIQCIEQIHGPQGYSTAFRFGNMAYSTDFNDLDEKALAALQNLDLWIVDCLSRTPKPTHNHLSLTLKWIEQVKPKRAVLTHMDHDLDYETLRKELPSHVEPAYDGMLLEF